MWLDAPRRKSGNRQGTADLLLPCVAPFERIGQAVDAARSCDQSASAAGARSHGMQLGSGDGSPGLATVDVQQGGLDGRGVIPLGFEPGVQSPGELPQREQLRVATYDASRVLDPLPPITGGLSLASSLSMAFAAWAIARSIAASVSGLLILPTARLAMRTCTA